MKYILFLPFVFLFIACQDKKDVNALSQMHWDRDMCSRCIMVISDRKHSVQVQNPNSNKIYKFDDIGCMVIWSIESKINWIKDAKISVTDAKTGEWCDAKTAYYSRGNTTPMNFGFSAYKSKNTIDTTKNIFSFSEVYKEIKK
ncbi:MAG: hypothetical protein COB17_04710 [Sulfurimonas sp.]|nr:MAG: hypothetical protein COB17_04710 [Sulfurimonas sp.]